MYSRLKLTNDPYPMFINEFVNYCGYEFNEEFRKRRFIEIVALRSVIIKYLRSEGLSLENIGSYFGFKHPTVLHNLKKDSKYDVNMKRYDAKLNEFLGIKNYHKEYYENNKERIKESNAIWQKENKEYLKMYRRAYYEKNIEKFKKYNDDFREKNKDYNKNWWKNNPEKSKEYYTKNVLKELKNDRQD